MDKAPKGKGFIKLDRTIFEHWIFQDAEKFKAFVDLIQLMRWKDEKLIIGNEVIVVPRGSYYTSELKLAERWGWSRKKVRAYLALLEENEMLIKKGTTKGTMLTLANYEVYQGEGTTKGTTEVAKKATSKQHPRQLQSILGGKNKIRFEKGTTEDTTSTLANSDVQPSQGTTEGTSKEHQRNIKRTSKEHQKNNEGYTKEEVKEVIRSYKNGEEGEEANPTQPFPTPFHEKIFNQFGEVTYKTWFLNTEIIESEKEIKFIAPNNFTKGVIETKFKDHLEKILSKKIIIQEA